MERTSDTLQIEEGAVPSEVERRKQEVQSDAVGPSAGSDP